MLTAGGRASPFGDLAKGATAAGADAGTGVQRANLFAGGWWALGHSLPQPFRVSSGKGSVSSTECLGGGGDFR